MFDTEEERKSYDTIYENNTLKSGYRYDLDIIRKFRDLGLIETYFDRYRQLSYRININHPYYIKRKRSEKLNIIKNESY
jgi:hypothetical protein